MKYVKTLLLIVAIAVSASSCAQVKVVGSIVPYPNGAYPTHIDSLGYAGYRVARDTFERNAITPLRRKYGMAVYTQADDALWILRDSTGLNVWTKIALTPTTDTGSVANSVLSTGVYANPSWLTALAWSKITGRPNTIELYGITNAYNKAYSDTTFGTLLQQRSNTTNITNLTTRMVTDSLGFITSLNTDIANNLALAVRFVNDSLDRGNKVAMSGSYADPSWITSLAYSKITGAPVLDTSSTAGVLSIARFINDSLGFQRLINSNTTNIANLGGRIATDSTGFMGYINSNAINITSLGSRIFLDSVGFMNQINSNTTNVSNLGARIATDSLGFISQFNANSTRIANDSILAAGKVSLTGSYTNPAWIVSLPYSKISGAPSYDTVAINGVLSISRFINDSTGFAGLIGANASNVAGLSTRIVNDSANTAGKVSLTGSYANPNWLTSFPWGKLTGTPTTAGQYGITDVYTKTQSDAAYATQAQQTSNSTNISNLGTRIAGDSVGFASSINANASSISGLSTRISNDSTNTAGKVSLSGSYVNPSWIASIPYSKITGTPPGADTVSSAGVLTIARFINDSTGFLGAINANSATISGLNARLINDSTNTAGKVSLSGAYTNPSWILSIPYSKITGGPNGTDTSSTTGVLPIARFKSDSVGLMSLITSNSTRITNDSTNTAGKVSLAGSYTNPAWIVSLPYSKLTGVPVVDTVSTTGLLPIARFRNDSTAFATSIGSNTTNVTNLATRIAGDSTGFMNSINSSATNIANLATRIANDSTGFMSSINSSATNITNLGTRIVNDSTNTAGKVSLTGSYSNPTWITGLAYSKITGVPATDTVSATGILPIARFRNDSTGLMGLITSSSTRIGNDSTNVAGLSTRITNDSTTTAGKVSLSGSYSNPTWITSLAYSKLTGAPTTDTTSASGLLTIARYKSDSLGVMGLLVSNSNRIANDSMNTSNKVSLLGSYTNPSWLVSIPYSKITGAPASDTVSSTGLLSIARFKNDSALFVLKTDTFNLYKSSQFQGTGSAGSPLTLDTLSSFGASTVYKYNLNVAGINNLGTRIANDSTGFVTSINSNANNITNLTARIVSDSTGFQNSINVNTSNITGLSTRITNDSTNTAGKVSLAGSYTNPAWIVSLPYSKVTGTPTNVSTFTNDASYATTTQVAAKLNITDTLNKWPSLNGFYGDPNWITAINWAKIISKPNFDSTLIPTLHSSGYYASLYDSKYISSVNTATYLTYASSQIGIDTSKLHSIGYLNMQFINMNGGATLGGDFYATAIGANHSNNYAVGNYYNSSASYIDPRTTTMGVEIKGITGGDGALVIKLGSLATAYTRFDGSRWSNSTDTVAALQTQSLSTSVVSTAVNYSVLPTDYTVKLTATTLTATLPTAVGIIGKIYVVKLAAAGTGTVATTSSQTIDGAATYSLTAQNKYLMVQSDGTNWMVIAQN